MRKSVTYFLCFLLVSGCATGPATGPKFSTLAPKSDDKSTVYFYRLPQVYGSGTSVKFHLSGLGPFDLPNGGYFQVQLEPGDYELAGIKHWSFAKFDKYRFAFEVHPNSYVFVRFTIVDHSEPGFIKWAGDFPVPTRWVGFKQVSRDMALVELKKTSLVE